MPNTEFGLPSSLPPLYEYRFLILDGEYWEKPLVFSIHDPTFYGNTSQIGTLQINGSTFCLDKFVDWDPNSRTFKYNLFFELWLYNSSNGVILYNERYVNLQLNLTRPL